MRISICGLVLASGMSLCAPLAAQTPPGIHGQSFDEAFFNGERKVILSATAEALRVLKPKDADYLAEVGRAHLAALDKAKATEAFKLAEALEPKDGNVLRLIAVAWLRQGFKNEALESYERVMQRDPKNKEILTQCAVDLAEVAQIPQAEVFMNQVALLDHERWESFLAFGRAFLVCGQRKKAAPWFARAVLIKPKEEKVLAEITRAFVDTQTVF